MALGSARASAEAVYWSLLLIFIFAGLGAAIFALRRWFFSSPAVGSAAVFSLQHLRDLRAQGQITKEEFEHLKTQLIEAASAPPPRGNGEQIEATRSFDGKANQIKRAAQGRR